MTYSQSLEDSWAELPPGARAVMEQQWASVAAGGLPCESSVIDAEGQVIAVGRNHAYDPAGGLRHASNILCNITAWHMPNSTPWDNPRGLV